MIHGSAEITQEVQVVSQLAPSSPIGLNTWTQSCTCGFEVGGERGCDFVWCMKYIWDWTWVSLHPWTYYKGNCFVSMAMLVHRLKIYFQIETFLIMKRTSFHLWNLQNCFSQTWNQKFQRKQESHRSHVANGKSEGPEAETRSSRWATFGDHFRRGWV